MSIRIRITGPGIHGAPTDENPTGEYPVGYEFDTEAGLPAGWTGRAVIVGDEPADGAVFVTGAEGSIDAEVIRKEVIDKANERIAALLAQHSTDLADANGRADKAESDLADANDQIAALNAKIAAFDPDGDGKPGGSAKQSPTALTGKNKAELLDIAKAENVEIEEGSTNDDIKTAIELAREEKAKA